MKKRTLSFVIALSLVFLSFLIDYTQIYAATSITARPTFSTWFGSSYAICHEGNLWAWGNNQFGQLGDGTITEAGYDYFINNNRRSPVKIMDNVVAISAGVNHVAAIRGDDSLWLWGSNENGQLGDGNGGNWGLFSPVPIRVLEDVSYVSAGGHHTMAILNDGSLWSFGDNR